MTQYATVEVFFSAEEFTKLKNYEKAKGYNAGNAERPIRMFVPIYQIKEIKRGEESKIIFFVE
ncbi:hypothetical protein A2331_01110 [Candidatus Falkowbacteria bacterium RIFOXYB2_FULL_34_18]|uniref:Uncharacterized protein n=1 Tax=Candidatus Falkowbacteria bacterium RIFOXYD2_FULL_34_120 TaxID=1798007 RepID=A0A1F5TSS2_9BACT|nr:MAG: hypothetical protein A2331_01110 [Candidatus Falkowbacteria bacterium RIFOXYB2_FULL_34_18]OGF30154.1 MAG: hypothetical protein A2500_02000 [Candidatus Falkowbacteria bacterium RIFOXYC12_FULL_34_55]OGF37710.1 MAG: hypothetical protein A2466_01740 [Candidatus Falkowbacteria bacterium RIFOXYC2_FULL_34_220]OGF39424.1 MAG: hypothetical protein A2515_02895 [Candidatus Falkowbacteria bacterium RIFOXYD12_FULL_34_57]OGF41889.1 MAG: hypothetical protein A2531_00830 [Candidatus Falkowbacteria bact